MSSILIYTDMDGTLLDHDTYRHDPVDPLLEVLASKAIPVIPCTSKTFAEVIDIRRELNNSHPFIVENGSAVYIPIGYFPRCPEGCHTHGQFWVKPFVENRSHWQKLVVALPSELKVQFQSYTQLGVDGVMSATGLSREQAQQSIQREFGEPLLWKGGSDQLERLIRILEPQGAKILVGGRFVHVSGAADKGRALNWLTGVYESFGSVETATVALGDSGNDLAMLAAANYAFIIRSPAHKPPTVKLTAAHRQPPVISTKFGPEGWAEVIEALLEQLV